MKVLSWTAAIWVVCTGFAFADSAENGIIVTGEGSVATPPDMATISLGVTETAQTAKEAMAQVSDKLSVILKELDALGVAAIDRQTRGFYLRAVHNNQPNSETDTVPRIVGYQAGNSVMVRVRDLAVLGDMLDEVIDMGANDFNGLSFGLKDKSSAIAKARANAVADAMLRANQLADAAGLKLGPILRMTESDNGGPVPMMEMAALRSGTGDAIAGGEVDVTARVTMVFDILPKQ